MSSLSTGDYFLTPASGVDLTTTSAVASEEASLSAVFGFALIRYAAAGALNCRADQLEVKTATDNPPELSNKVAFTVIVP